MPPVSPATPVVSWNHSLKQAMSTPDGAGNPKLYLLSAQTRFNVQRFNGVGGYAVATATCSDIRASVSHDGGMTWLPAVEVPFTAQDGSDLSDGRVVTWQSGNTANTAAPKSTGIVLDSLHANAAGKVLARAHLASGSLFEGSGPPLNTPPSAGNIGVWGDTVAPMGCENVLLQPPRGSDGRPNGPAFVATATANQTGTPNNSVAAPSYLFFMGQMGGQAPVGSAMRFSAPSQLWMLDSSYADNYISGDGIPEFTNYYPGTEPNFFVSPDGESWTQTPYPFSYFNPPAIKGFGPISGNTGLLLPFGQYGYDGGIFLPQENSNAATLGQLTQQSPLYPITAPAENTSIVLTAPYTAPHAPPVAWNGIVVDDTGTWASLSISNITISGSSVSYKVTRSSSNENFQQVLSEHNDGCIFGPNTTKLAPTGYQFNPERTWLTADTYVYTALRPTVSLCADDNGYISWNPPFTFNRNAGADGGDVFTTSIPNAIPALYKLSPTATQVVAVWNWQHRVVYALAENGVITIATSDDEGRTFTTRVTSADNMKTWVKA